MKIGTKKENLEKIHIHRVVQMQETTYARVRQKYDRYIDEKGMIDPEVLKRKTTV